MAEHNAFLDPAIFENLRASAEEESRVHEELGQIVRNLTQAVSGVQAQLSRMHSIPRTKYTSLLLPKVEDGIKSEVELVKQLDELASRYPYYKYNQRWTRVVQSAISTVLTCAWLGGMNTGSKPGEIGRLLTLEEVGVIFGVPTKLEDRDAFHLTIEEYLLAITDLTSELARLAVNATTMGDHRVPVQAGSFLRDLFAGFQLLNLKNDTLRRRVDGVKYDLKRVEDVVYDLTLRGMLPADKGGDEADMEGMAVEYTEKKDNS